MYKIYQFKNINQLAALGSVRFTGTVKLHGTNAAIDFRGDKPTFHKKSAEITVDDDNFGFAKAMSAIVDELDFPNREVVKVYGEWCGEGVQKGVGISQLPKKFVIFDAVREDGKSVFTAFSANIALNPNKLTKYNNLGVYFINQFPTFTYDIDFSSLRSTEAFARDCYELVLAVENECPVAKHFGISGIGEGIVWKNEEYNLVFKTKGEKHSVSKTKGLIPLTEGQLNERTKYVDFAEIVVTKNRVNQAIAETGAEDRSDLGNVMRWIYNDVITEEADFMEANDISPKKVGADLSRKTKTFLQELLF